MAVLSLTLVPLYTKRRPRQSGGKLGRSLSVLRPCGKRVHGGLYNPLRIIQHPSTPKQEAKAGGNARPSSEPRPRIECRPHGSALERNRTRKERHEET